MLKILYGKKKYQPFFKQLEFYAMYGQNFGNAQNVYSSGEAHFVQKILPNLLNSGQIIFMDVGANTGEYTELFLQTSLASRATCFLFEPQDELYQKLVDKFKFNSSVEVSSLGLGEIEENVTLYKDDEINTLASIHPRSIHGRPLSIKEVIRISAIDSYCSQINLSNIDFLKIDVEGNELAVLKGALKLIQEKKIRIIQFEFGNASIFSRTYFKDFWDLLTPYYSINRILKDGLIEIHKYEYTLENFLTANYIAILK